MGVVSNVAEAKQNFLAVKNHGRQLNNGSDFSFGKTLQGQTKGKALKESGATGKLATISLQSFKTRIDVASSQFPEHMWKNDLFNILMVRILTPRSSQVSNNFVEVVQIKYSRISLPQNASMNHRVILTPEKRRHDDGQLY